MIKRKCKSWIDKFVEETNNLEAPEIFRRWAAITTIAAALEQKVWLTTSSKLFPNLYTFLVGHPGVGKTRTVYAAREYLAKIPEFHIAPTSMTTASMVDALTDSKRVIIRPPDAPIEYNSMMICADELGAFMHQYDKEIIAVLSSFYDQHPYGQNRRGKEIKIKIQSPQLNILAGSTPSNLIEFMPEGAWLQGFTSRIIMVFSDERIVGDDFAVPSRGPNQELIHDIAIINNLAGQFEVTADYRNAVGNWRELGEPPQPNHPKLTHYNTRRRVHLYKLSMVSAIDRSNTLLLTKDDFNRAMGWLLEAEQLMPDIFKAGASNADQRAIEEIYHYVLTLGKVHETKLVRFVQERVPAHAVMRVIENMMRAGQLRIAARDAKTMIGMYEAVVKTEF